MTTESPPHSSNDPLETALTTVSGRAERFAREPLDKKIAWLYQMRERATRLAGDWVELTCQKKRISAAEPVAGEEWLTGPMATIRMLRLLSASLSDIQKSGKPRLPGAPKLLDNGQVSVPIYPSSMYDKGVLAGVRADARLEAGVSLEELPQASFYGGTSSKGNVTAVLGAGNLNSIPILDALHKLFVEGSAVVLKLNPVNEYIGPVLQQIAKPLIEQGYLAILEGNADIGSRLCADPRVTRLHMTGSDRTHDAIVWGANAAERQRRREAGEPALSKPMTSELGNITPVCVAPGAYTDRQLSAMAENIAGMVTQNASFNCVSAKMLVLPKGWSEGAKLLAKLEQILADVPTRFAFYPGAHERYKALTLEAPTVRRYGQEADGHLPWTLITGLDAGDDSALPFRMEPFCSILSVVEVEGREPKDFLHAATDFCNEKLWGTLGITFFVHPSLLDTPPIETELESCIRRLRYGMVAVNQWIAVGYPVGTVPWGGHPSSRLEDIQSGTGWVHNSYMLERVEKCVIRGPLAGPVRPPWSPLHRKAQILGRRMMELEADPSPWRLSKLGLGALGA